MLAAGFLSHFCLMSVEDVKRQLFVGRMQLPSFPWLDTKLGRCQSGFSLLKSIGE